MAPNSDREKALLDELEADGVPAKRRLAVFDELQAVATDRSVPVLQTLLNARDDRLAIGALHVLARIGTQPAIDTMLSVLDAGDSLRVGWTAELLGRMRVHRAAAALARCLTLRAGTLDSRGKRMVIYALGRLGERTAVPALAPLLSDPRRKTRKAAAIALTRIGGSAGREALQAAATTLPRWRRQAARRASRADAR